ncbi:MAG: PorP/SprF family type IX secretion system membrane protein [Saprospiraceae bacterium]|nr:PorP/SprF family type IX secretion system membrane protein [Saprospiraceae bacterium]
MPGFQRTKWLIFSALLGFLAFQSNAQDIHYTQFHRAPARLNPGLTGMFSGDFRLTGHGRSQWSSVPVPYETGALSMDFKWPFQPLESGWLTGGIFLDSDKSGYSNMKLIQTGLSVGYIQPISKQIFLSAGVQYRFTNRSFNLDALRFNDQFNGDVFDPDLPNGESMSSSSVFYNSISTGLNLRVQNDKTRFKFDIGAGGFHLNKPKTSYYDFDPARLPILINIYSDLTLPLNPILDIDLYSIYQIQDVYQEVVLGTLLRYHLSVERTKEISLALGAYYRFGDAFAPALEARYSAWTLGFSYDLNISAFNVATLGRGGPELHIQYVWTRVAPPPVFKACPIF